MKLDFTLQANSSLPDQNKPRILLQFLMLHEQTSGYESVQWEMDGLTIWQGSFDWTVMANLLLVFHQGIEKQEKKPPPPPPPSQRPCLSHYSTLNKRANDHACTWVERGITIGSLEECRNFCTELHRIQSFFCNIVTWRKVKRWVENKESHPIGAYEIHLIFSWFFFTL